MRQPERRPEVLPQLDPMLFRDGQKHLHHLGVKLGAGAAANLFAGVRPSESRRTRSSSGGRSEWRQLTVEGGWYAVLGLPLARSDEDFALEVLTYTDTYIYTGIFFDFSIINQVVRGLIARAGDFKLRIHRIIISR